VRIREVGVEEEFLLFRADEPRLVEIGPHVVATAERDADDDAQFEKELKAAQAELATSPTTSLDDLGTELGKRRGELAAAARERGARVVATGTSPAPGGARTTDNPRYRQMADRFAAVERRQLTCAMHVHVSVDSDDEGVSVLNRAAPWLSVLLALSANSPFHDGRDTGYASYRRVVWGQWPSAGPAGPFADVADYRRLVDDLVATGAARDEGMVYFDARLSANYPTVELRVCDVCFEPADAVTLAGLCRALVATVAAHERAPAFRPELLEAAGWRAARFGMSGELVDLPRAAGAGPLVPAWDLVDALVDYVGDQLDAAGDRPRVRAGLADIRRRGTGAERQRAAVRGTDGATDGAATDGHVAGATDGDVGAAIDAATVRQPTER
jgi:glutamate---cysteine ligase / carboxylate-amine ligase